MSVSIRFSFNLIFSLLLCYLPIELRCEHILLDGDSTKIIQSSFNLNNKEWSIKWPNRVSQYDLVYKSPPIDPLQGIPLGNGEIGSLIWCDGSKIIIAVNKSDLWDDGKTEKPGWYGALDEQTTLRHAGRIIIDFNYPIFDELYISEFDARLNLAEASFELTTSSPFGDLAFNAFINFDNGILFYDIISDLKDDVPVEISLERYGSRTYSRWYSSISDKTSIGLDGTNSYIENKSLFITQKLTTGTFAIGGVMLNSDQADVIVQDNFDHKATINVSGLNGKPAQFAFSVTSPLSSDPISELSKKLDDAKENGRTTYYQAHKRKWKSLWTRSFVDYGDDYLNNLWHLTLYYTLSSQGGNYPGRFINGLWGWNRDIQNWNVYFHENQQQLYWPLNATGHSEFIESYLDFRFNSLKHAKKYAKEHFNADGAFVSDLTDRNGFNSPSTDHNHTPVAEIALEFWRQYQFTNDKDFLRERALPYILEASEFFESLMVKGDDGYFHPSVSTGYEGWIELEDGLTDLSLAKKIFETALVAIKEVGLQYSESKQWKNILDNIAPLPIKAVGDLYITGNENDYRINTGVFKNQPVPTNKIFLAGWGVKEERWLMTYFRLDDEKYSFFNSSSPGYSPPSVRNGLKLHDGLFPTIPSAPIFPSGLIGLKDEGTEMFNVAKATTMLYGPECTGWDPVSISMARLGMAEELELVLNDFPRRWQIFPNGWGHWGLENAIRKDAEWYFRTNNVTVADLNKKIELRTWPFRHTSMEAMSVLTTAMNESLLQSYEGVLRIAPAFPNSKEGRFTLHAAGGFIVSAEVRQGNIKWISIVSKYGNTCKIDIPWEEATMSSSLKNKSKDVKNGVIEVLTKKDESLLIVPKGVRPEDWTIVNEIPPNSQNPKFHHSGESQLGLPRMY
ncbi:MAG: hypothetical protein RLO81_03150 [Fulvivirga sp.]|uniref:glycosyl hydrolase family 95 catalytic domain-containing protein n=1 Tax=Fulvivirga sp. TaxID=1931237 RepID=UPI0032EDE455